MAHGAFSSLLFCVLALRYFNFGGEEQVRDWTSLQLVNLTFVAFGIEILFFMNHAQSPLSGSLH